MALTLLEAAKLNTGDVFKAGVMMKFAETSDILRVLPFEGINGNSLKYNIEETVAALQKYSLPGIYADMFLSGRKTN